MHSFITSVCLCILFLFVWLMNFTINRLEEALMESLFQNSKSCSNKCQFLRPVMIADDLL